MAAANAGPKGQQLSQIFLLCEKFYPPPREIYVSGGRVLVVNVPHLFYVHLHCRSCREIVNWWWWNWNIGKDVAGWWLWEWRDRSRQVGSVCVARGVPVCPRTTPACTESIPAAGQCPCIVRQTDGVHWHHLSTVINHSTHRGRTSVSLLAGWFVTISLYFYACACQTGRQRHRVVRSSFCLFIYPPIRLSVNKLVNAIFWKLVNGFWSQLAQMVH